jgi:hypothetical protein
MLFVANQQHGDGVCRQEIYSAFVYEKTKLQVQMYLILDGLMSWDAYGFGD